ncbi:hypothetical protein A1Q1_02602 [Trichosporon asahii var. asahii CBS 2479]|uniref:Uncharacterized protein n=1 Tax=Trichosporon asahii var. asahii (strain ATCC 90039 / CBS 2479 / JCM 2466 / KCTC 7840 / NBRC 103889/ NCYC 2677 / UAMH 7654) TaxID=1186058 RepID=J6EUN9_TRIAS|nr:hypothetical protein A1Q1_02602 [Trichosporon asahii var. asahii CBS 2479]EJT48319.1 hypothetical protein A1Q1_02602 [Trichosporon asahii var. asahii CBS 2479]
MGFCALRGGSGPVWPPSLSCLLRLLSAFAKNTLQSWLTHLYHVCRHAHSAATATEPLSPAERPIHGLHGPPQQPPPDTPEPHFVPNQRSKFRQEAENSGLGTYSYNTGTMAASDVSDRSTRPFLWHPLSQSLDGNRIELYLVPCC